MLAAGSLVVTFEGAPRPGDELMARDAAAFDAAECGAEPAHASVRWFRWDRPTVSVGRGQDPAVTLDLARCAADGVPVVVRPTGGRAVYHDAEWTYAALVPLAHPVLGGSLGHSCRSVVAWIAGALADAYGLVVDAEPVAPGAVPDGARALERGACFVRSYGYELSVGGRKLMGSAQRRGRVALLQQGSLLTGPGQERLARYLRGPAAGGHAPRGDTAEVEEEARRRAALARATTHLAALLGRPPEREAFERAFRAHGQRIETASARLW